MKTLDTFAPKKGNIQELTKTKKLHCTKNEVFHSLMKGHIH